MTRRRNLAPIDPQSWTISVANQLAARLKAQPKEFRYVEIRFHDGNQWTLEARWEQLRNGEWVEVPWTEFE